MVCHFISFQRRIFDHHLPVVRDSIGRARDTKTGLPVSPYDCPACTIFPLSVVKHSPPLLGHGFSSASIVDNNKIETSDLLDKDKCLAALASLRQAKWFQVHNRLFFSFHYSLQLSGLCFFRSFIEV